MYNAVEEYTHHADWTWTEEMNLEDAAWISAFMDDWSDWDHYGPGFEDEWIGAWDGWTDRDWYGDWSFDTGALNSARPWPQNPVSTASSSLPAGTASVSQTGGQVNSLSQNVSTVSTGSNRNTGSTASGKGFAGAFIATVAFLGMIGKSEQYPVMNSTGESFSQSNRRCLFNNFGPCDKTWTDA